MHMEVGTSFLKNRVKENDVVALAKRRKFFIKCPDYELWPAGLLRVRAFSYHGGSILQTVP